MAPITCAQQVIPLHRHEQSITLLALQPSVTAGFGKGFQLSFQLPLALKATTIAYSLVDGSSYDPPYGDNHHRTETRFGPGDARLMARLLGQPPGRPVTMGLGLGLSLPTGKTEDNPFELAAREEPHQHLQFGSGTFDPLASIQLIVRTEPIGLYAWGDGRFPLYSNARGYRPGLSLRGGLGPTFRPPDPLRSLQLTLLLDGAHEAPARWGELPGENSGRDAIGLSLGLSLRITPKLVAQGQLHMTVLEHTEGAQLDRPVTASLTLSGLLDLRKPHVHGGEDDHHDDE